MRSRQRFRGCSETSAAAHRRCDESTRANLARLKEKSTGRGVGRTAVQRMHHRDRNLCAVIVAATVLTSGEAAHLGFLPYR